VGTRPDADGLESQHIKITFRLYTHLAEAAGAGRLELTLPRGSDVAHALNHLSRSLSRRGPVAVKLGDVGGPDCRVRVVFGCPDEWGGAAARPGPRVMVTCVVLVNGRALGRLPQGPATVLEDGDEVCLIPPLAGG